MYLIIICFVQQRNRLDLAWGWVSVVCYSLFSAIYGFADTINYHKVSKIFETTPQNIERASSIVGLTNQIGAIIGSIIGFELAVNALHD